MRIVTKEYKVFTYNELSEEAKEKVKQDYLETQDASFFTENILEDLQATTDFTNLSPYYSLGYCQGDGLCLHGRIDFDEIQGDTKKIFFKNFTISDYKALSNLKEYSHIEFKHVGHYYHKYSVDIGIYIDGNHSEKMYDFMSKTADKLLKNAKEWYFAKCDEYEKWGYDYFYEVSEEDLKEHCEINEYEFYENGKIFY